MANDDRSSALGDSFDRQVRALDGLPGVVKTQPRTIRVVNPLLSTAQTFIIQTYRQNEEGESPRDTIFLEYMAADGTYRITLPPQVADTIARQRDALVGKNRRAAAAKAVLTRKARGIEPGFLKNRGSRQRKTKS